ncbi:MAG: dTDP-4-dehydrorhamnose reductase [Flavisolibacter sp.]
MTNKILVTGANGQLGSDLRDLSSSYPQYEFVFTDVAELSITDRDAVNNFFREQKPAYLVNCAAYTAVDKAESERELCDQINGTAVGILASACKQYGTRFIHISTDYVFDGNASAPLKETDEVDPVNAYGASKLLGEQLAVQNDPGAIIIRTSWVYSFYGKNFVKTMMRLMSERESIGVVSDQVGSPTYAADLAEAIMQIISSGKWVPGIYNYSNEGIISWLDFANEIKTQIKSSCIVNPLSTEQFPTPAKRPKYSALDKTKIQTTFSVRLKDWKDSLRTCINKLTAQA